MLFSRIKGKINEIKTGCLSVFVFVLKDLANRYGPIWFSVTVKLLIGQENVFNIVCGEDTTPYQPQEASRGVAAKI